jgi:hypothetical protein
MRSEFMLFRPWPYRRRAPGSAVPCGRAVLIFAGLSLSLLSGCLADLRPAALRDRPPSVESVERGRELLRRARAAVGYQSYRAIETIRLMDRDEWRGLGKFLNWWPTTPQRVEA